MSNNNGSDRVPSRVVAKPILHPLHAAVWAKVVQAENIQSGISNFQLDNCSGRDHNSFGCLSKFTLSGAGAPARSRPRKMKHADVID